MVIYMMRKPSLWITNP